MLIAKQIARDKQFGLIIYVLSDKFIRPFKTNSNETDFAGKFDFINFAVTTACMARKTILIGSLVLFNIFG